MLTLRCTKKLLSRLKATPDPTPPASTGRLGDWYAHYVIVSRQHLVLAVSERTLLPVVLAAAPISTLIPRFVEDLCEVLRALGVPEDHVRAEQDEMQDVTVAKTASRSVLGSINDFVQLLDAFLENRTPLEVALRLAEVPCKPIGWANPRRKTLEVFSRSMGQ